MDSKVDLDRQLVKGLLWEGASERIFEEIASALFAAGIPCRGIRPESEIARRLKPHFELWILKRDSGSALRVSVEATAQLPPRFVNTETCPSCGVELVIGFARCAACGTQLRLEAVQASTRSFEQEPPAVSSEYDVSAKNCSICGWLYPGGRTHCTECGASLIGGIIADGPRTLPQASDSSVIVWQGCDPVAFSRVLAQVRLSGYAHAVCATHDHFVFELALPQPRYQIWVLSSSAKDTAAALSKISQRPPFENHHLAVLLLLAFSLSGLFAILQILLFGGLFWVVIGNKSTIKNEESEELDDEFTEPSSAVETVDPVPDEHETWPNRKLTELTAEVWAGDDPVLPGLLKACLAENYIRIRTESAGARTRRILVHPTDEARAREIIREVTEASPPA